MENIPQSRRRFLATIAFICASAGLLWRYLTPRSAGKRRVLASAAAADVPLNGALVFYHERLALLRDDAGYYALSLVCTHLGCTVVVTESDLSCPCHGSRFDRQGQVITGPADKPLVKMKVEKLGEERVQVVG
jgi:cytochrome b6-f complex iron-sulfur subunit